MAILLMLAAAAAASNAPAAPVASAAPAAQAPVPVQDRIVCKTERFVGSHLSQRICKPKSEWETAKRDAKEALSRMTLINPPEEGGN